MDSNFDPKKLIHTEQGGKWLRQFDPIDQESAISIANNLTLVSHIEFKRNLRSKLEEVASSIEGSVGFFAIREIDATTPFYSQTTSHDGKSVNALLSSNQGGEVKIVSIIRELCLSNPKKYLNHPTLESLRESRSDAIIFVDDFIGYGDRTRDFLDSFWRERTIVSWLSGKQIKFHVVAYSGTKEDIGYIKKHKSKPQIHIYQGAPTFNSSSWSRDKKEKVKTLCREYDSIVNKGRENVWRRYGERMVTMIFEHGCPNDTPAILWSNNFEGNDWDGLFPNHTISSSTTSIFPPEIAKGYPVQALQEYEQWRMTNSGGLLRKMTLTVLDLISKGQRKSSTISCATGLDIKNCERLIKECIEWSLITKQREITDKGQAKLSRTRKLKTEQSFCFNRGTDYYYPKQLREATRD